MLLWASLEGSDGKDSPCSVVDEGLLSGLERSLGEGNDNPFQYTYLENSMDKEPWWAIVHGVSKSQTQLFETNTDTIRTSK